MTLWVLGYAEKPKIRFMAIKDRLKQPIYMAELHIKDSYKGPRPHKIRLLTGKKKEEFIPPQQFIELLREANRIMLAEGGNPANEATFLEMLKGFQLKADRVKICKHCWINKRFNFVNSKSVKYLDELICLDCAKEELLRAVRSAGVKYGEKSVDFLEQVLSKTRDLDRTIRMLTPERLDPEFTRYDTIRTNPTSAGIRIKNLPLKKKFKEMLLEKSETLLPVQALSIEAGLLEGKNQFVVSATATGKTLIGEMAGVQNLLNKKGKMLYLVPLVALANQKYDQFKDRYSKLGLTTSI
ncbi:MAG: DEAD/DEAH box helicase, partial [Methanosarcina sp.]|nr:DEAD/DEAH box helicase [Methanosarcina sp.]